MLIRTHGLILVVLTVYSLILLLGRVALSLDRGVAGYSHQTFPWTICRSVRRSVGASVGLSSALWKTAVAVWLNFGIMIIGRTGPRMRHIVGFGDRSMGRSTFGGEFWAHHCNQWALTFPATGPSSQITLGKLVVI